MQHFHLQSVKLGTEENSCESNKIFTFVFILSYILSTFALRYRPMLKKFHSFPENKDIITLPVIDVIDKTIHYVLFSYISDKSFMCHREIGVFNIL